MSFPGSTLRKRPSQFDDPDFMNSLAGPRVGPDLAAQPVQTPQFAPLPQLPPMENRSSSGQVAGEALGQGASLGLNHLMSTRAPDVKPQAGGNPLGDLHRSGGKFLGLFGEGGRLRRVGDTALVGDEGPEVAIRQPGGETEIIPLGDGRPSRIQRMVEEMGGVPPLQPTPAPNTLKSFGGFGASDPALTTPQGQSPEAQPTLARSPFVGLRPDSTVPQVENDPFKAQLQPVIRMPPGYSGEGIPSPAGESTTRERIADPRAFLQHRLDEIATQPTNVNTNSRGGGALRSAGRLGLRALMETGNPVAALGAAATGLGVGLVDKTFDEKLREEEAGGRMSRALAGMDARAGAQSQLEGRAADRALKFSQTLKNLNPPPDYERVETPDGFVYVDRNNPSGAAVQTGLKAPVKPGARPQTVRLKNEDGSEKIVERGADGVWRDTGLKSAGQPRRRITVGGETFELPEAEAARVLAQIESANIQADAQGAANAVTASNENADRGFNAKLQAWKLEGDRTADYNGLREKITDAKRRFDAAQRELLSVDPATITGDKAKAAYTQRQLDFQTVADELNELNKQEQAARGALNPEFVEFRPDGMARLKPQPSAPQVQAKPAPAKRTSGVAPASAMLITKDSTEAEVRAEAKRRGKDENAAVEKWRKLKR